MSERPPALATRLLGWALGPSEEARAALGDLAEDFAAAGRRRGWTRASLWYWNEAVRLAIRALAGRLVGRPIVRDMDDDRTMTMTNLLSRNGLLQDAAYALRAIRRDRIFFAFATLIVGLGVGASTAVFSVMSPLLIRPLPFEAPDRLVLIENGNASGGLSGVTSRTSNVHDFRAQANSFEGIAGFNAFFDQLSYNLTGVGDPARLVGVNVTHDFLDVLGVETEIGRNFSEDEGRWGGFVDRDGGPRAIILTHGFWVRRFGADPGVVGRSFPINDEPVTVVGVLPVSFDFSSIFTPTTAVDFLLPWPISDGTDNWGNTTTMVARLRPGVTIASAQDELDGILVGLEGADPDRWGLAAVISGLQERIARPFRTGMLLLGTAAGLVMLIVCVNLSNMLLARSPRRRREMAVRQTLGATRPRLVRQLLMEGVLLSSSGAVVGLAIAEVATRFVSSRSGLEIPMLSLISVDGTALLFTAAVAILAGLAVSTVPALQVSEGREVESLGGSTRGGGGARGARRFREALVVAEVAMACVLLVVGGLVLRSFQSMMRVDLGFEADDAVAWQFSPSRDFENLDEAVAFYREVAQTVEAVPGVESVGMVDMLPLGTNRTWSTRVIGKQYDENQPSDGFFPHVAGPGYLQTMGIPLLKGRYLTPDDNTESQTVILVNEEAERAMFPGGEAIGQSITWGDGEAEVVGVVGDVKHRGLDLSADREIYFPMTQVWAFSTIEMVVRTTLPPSSIVPAVSSAVATVDAQMPTEDWRTMDSVVERSVSPRRFTLQLLVAFALCALLLAALGIYGVLSYSVSERLPEIGIRMALGESAGDVRRSVVTQTLVLAGIGVGLGTLIALVTTRLLGSLLYGVAPTDPATFAMMIVLLLAVALVSGLIPAIRASRTDSASALRSAA